MKVGIVKMGNYNMVLLGDLLRGFDEICSNGMYKLRVEILNTSFVHTYVNKKKLCFRNEIA